MSQKSGFFNALLTAENEYDRKYNANDYSDNLAVVISNGVLRGDNNLKVTASGMIATVAAGRAWINGKYYYNDAPYVFGATTAPTGGNRYDRIMLRLNTAVAARSISLVYVTGTAASTPTKPAPTRSGTIYDLVLADIYVTANATSIVVTDTRADASLCGWVYSTSGDNSFFTELDGAFNTWFQAAKNTLSSVTLFKRYTQNITLASAASSVSFNIPQYDANTCFVEVYVNGVFDNRHTISNNVITFVGSLVAGTVVTVNCYKSIDGTGIMTVSDEITQLQNQYATLAGISKYTYKCTGTNDNISLSEIAQAFLNGSYTVGSLSAAAEAFLTAIGGNNYLAAMPSDAQITIEVTGRLGATTPYAGSGTSSERYKWFSLGRQSVTDKKIVFDFAKCEAIKITPQAHTFHIIFFGTDLYVKNANVDVLTTNAGASVTMVVGGNKFGRIQFTDCRLKIRTTSHAIIAENGEFTNCLLHTKSTTGNAFIFSCEVTECYARMNGGTASCYIGDSSKSAAVFYISSTATNAVIMATNVNCPTISQSGYIQKNLASASAGMIQIIGAVSAMTSIGTNANLNIIGQIWKSKY